MPHNPMKASVGALIEDLSRHGEPTAGGSATALSAAFAAALTTMVARASRETWPDAGGTVARAEALRAQLGRLTERNVMAFATAQALLLRAGADRERHGAGVAPGIDSDVDPEDGDRRLEAALQAAAETPVLIAEAAAEVAGLAAEAARQGNADHRADAVVAVMLADAAARAAAHLVEINLAVRSGDAFASRARDAATAASAAAAGLAER